MLPEGQGQAMDEGLYATDGTERVWIEDFSSRFIFNFIKTHCRSTPEVPENRHYGFPFFCLRADRPAAPCPGRAGTDIPVGPAARQQTENKYIATNNIKKN